MFILEIGISKDDCKPPVLRASFGTQMAIVVAMNLGMALCMTLFAVRRRLRSTHETVTV
jgi:hypothetical protein